MMEIEEVREGELTVLSPRGRIDHLSAVAFERALGPHVERCREGKGSLVLDLAAVDYMSSAGLRVLMVAAKETQPRDGRIAICGLQPVMQEIFEISRFDRLLDVYPTRAAALAGLES